MRRIHIFLIVLLSGIVSYAAVTWWSVTLLSQSQRGYGDMMGMGGMGSWWTPPTSSQGFYSTPILLLSIITLAIAAVGVTGLVYTVLRPETGASIVKTSQVDSFREEPVQSVKQVEAIAPPKPEDGVDAVLKVLKPDELRVIEILRKNDDHYLQKWISKDSGMSRLQTHRVITRLAERKLVTLTKSGNTNEVSLAPWLSKYEVQSG